MPWPIFIPAGLVAASIVMATNRLDGVSHAPWWFIAAPAAAGLVLLLVVVALAHVVDKL